MSSFRRLSPLILVLFVGLACRGPLSPEITEYDLKYHLGILSSDGMQGRMTGTPRMERAVHYIVGEYRRIGLQPFFPDYIMEFSFKDGVQARGSNTIEWQDGRSGHPAAAVPIPFGRAGAVEGEVISGGHCLPPHNGTDELKDIEAKGVSFQGKILFCHRFGPSGNQGDHSYTRLIAFQSKYANALRFKPLAVVFARDEGDEVHTEQFSQESAEGPPAVFLPDRDKAFKASSLESGRSLGKAKIITDFGPLELTGKNIGAMLRPLRKGQRLIFVGAHYDHLGFGLAGSSMGPMGQIYNGADDNGSGTVLVLELAAAMKARLDHDPGYLPPDVNVVFLNFDAEERGLIGSSRFVDSPLFDGAHTIAMLNADMVGRLRASRGLFVQGADTGDPSLKRILEESYAKVIPGILSEGDRPEIRWMKGGLGPSDHASFYRKKVPVVFLFTGSHGEYHKPEDDDSLINYRGIRALAVYSEEIVRRLAFASPAPAFRQVKEEPRREDFDFKVRLGIIPGSYDSGINGLLVGGILDGAPVARTGLKEGDIIIELGGKTIHDIHDLMRFLNDARTGVTYVLRWTRNGRVMEARTELMSTED